MVVNPQLTVMNPEAAIPQHPHTFNSRRMTVIWPCDAMARSKCNLLTSGSSEPLAQKTKIIEYLLYVRYIPIYIIIQ